MDNEQLKNDVHFIFALFATQDPDKEWYDSLQRKVQMWWDHRREFIPKRTVVEGLGVQFRVIDSKGNIGRVASPSRLTPKYPQVDVYQE